MGGIRKLFSRIYFHQIDSQEIYKTCFVFQLYMFTEKIAM